MRKKPIGQLVIVFLFFLAFIIHGALCDARKTRSNQLIVKSVRPSFKMILLFRFALD